LQLFRNGKLGHKIQINQGKRPNVIHIFGLLLQEPNDLKNTDCSILISFLENAERLEENLRQKEVSNCGNDVSSKKPQIPNSFDLILWLVDFKNLSLNNESVEVVAVLPTNLEESFGVC